MGINRCNPTTQLRRGRFMHICRKLDAIRSIVAELMVIAEVGGGGWLLMEELAPRSGSLWRHIINQSHSSLE